MKRFLIENLIVIILLTLVIMIGTIGMFMNSLMIIVITVVMGTALVMTRIPSTPLLVGSTIIIIITFIASHVLAIGIAVSLILSYVFNDPLLWTQKIISAKMLKLAE